MKKRTPILFLIGIAVKLLFPQYVQAVEQNQFITIVNPVRISLYNNNPGESLRNEYTVIKNYSLPATWLLTYDALKNADVVSVARGMDKKQEFGILLEVTANFANNVGVIYKNTGSWHHASSVFLSGYTQEERIKLIDGVFTVFKQKFGYYPISVGSWWTDSFSLSYIKERYGITANLVCSDQFSTDGYQIWGQPWEVPYYPSKFHAGIPAPDTSVKLDIVNIQWAPRDPINGYYNSLFSTQDYSVAGESLNLDYFEKLVNLYASRNTNPFGQVTVGLEADLDPLGYRGGYSKQLGIVKEMAKSGDFQVTTMASFSEWYRKKFPDLNPDMKIESKDLISGKNMVIWYQTSNYRAGVYYDERKNETKIFDLRIYDKKMIEPYYYSPNRSFNLSINIFPIIDEVAFPEKVLVFEGASQINPVDFIESYPSLPNGNYIKDYSLEATHFFKQKRFVLDLILGSGWNYFKKVDYLIPNGEIEALSFLSTLPRGSVLVYDYECLQCEYHTDFRPPALSNKRKYVEKYGKHKIYYSDWLINPKSREEAKKDLEKTGVKYLYLVKFESYQEIIPFSPGDLGVEKIFSNANAEIWAVRSPNL